MSQLISEQYQFCSVCKAIIEKDQDCPFCEKFSASFLSGGKPPPATTELASVWGADAGGMAVKPGSSVAETGVARASEQAAPDSDSQPCGEFCSTLIAGGDDSAGSIPPILPVALAQIDETPQGMELWERTRLEIQQALALSAVGFVEAGIRLHQAKEEAHWSKLGLQSWEEYCQDLGLELSKASRLIKIALFVKEQGLGQEFIRMAGETRLYLAYRAMCKQVISKEELLALPEKSCYELRDKLGYEREPFIFVCSNCGADYVCQKCGQGKVKRIAPTQKGQDA